MIITLVLIAAKIALAFFTVLVLAIVMQIALSGTVNSAIDRYAMTIMFWTMLWTIALTEDLPRAGISGLLFLVGCLPVTLAHCRVAKRQHGRYPDFLIIVESIRNVKSPFIAVKRRFAAKKAGELGTWEANRR